MTEMTEPYSLHPEPCSFETGSSSIRCWRGWLLAGLTLFWLSTSVWAEADPTVDFRPWLGRDGQPLPFASDEEVVAFLQTAQVVSMERLDAGINKPYKVLLEQNSMLVHAVFRDVKSRKPQAKVRGSVRIDYRDDAIFEVAAYELNRLLGLRIVPPAVVRQIDGKQGSLQLWVEGAMTESKRLKEKLMPPNLLQWSQMRQIRYIFDELVHNEDRNLGNLLIDSDWRVWLIDHTQCFHPYARIYYRDRLSHISNQLWSALKETPPDLVRRRMADYLTAGQIDALLGRWRLLMEHYSDQIEELGPKRVLFSL